MNKIQNIIIDLLKKELNLPKSFVVTNDLNLINDLGMDDLDLPIVLTSLETYFKITISDEDVKDMVTIGDLINICMEKIHEKKNKQLPEEE